MPHDLPDWQLVYHYFAQWKKDGTWKRLNDTLRVKVRKKAGREAEPTAGILDSQSVKTTEEAETKGYDAGKKVKGRKRHLLVDTLGLLLLVWMTTADVQDRDAVQAVLPIRVLKSHLLPVGGLRLARPLGTHQGCLLYPVERTAGRLKGHLLSRDLPPGRLARRSSRIHPSAHDEHARTTGDER
jgi:transposase